MSENYFPTYLTVDRKHYEKLKAELAACQQQRDELVEACERALPVIQYILAEGWEAPPFDVTFNEVTANNILVDAIRAATGEELTDEI